MTSERERAERIERLVVDEYFRNPPPFVRAMASEPTLGVARAFVIEWTKFSLQFPRWVGQIVANCPEFPVIAFEIENLMSEVVRDPAADTNHYELLIRLGDALGLSRSEIESHQPSDEAKRAFSYWWDAARQPDWLLGFAAINGLEILGDRTLPRRHGLSQGTGLAVHPWTRLGLPEAALEFFRVSDEADEGHGRETVEILARYAHDDERMSQAMEALRRTIGELRSMMDGMQRVAEAMETRAAAG
ncbi:MAG TPA: iron-containing redox enzyme family protein [Dehalococcoidia bacterium]|nr:iron-containing redox enzyme family protein [Dehalococcoidia bacterium]